MHRRCRRHGLRRPSRRGRRAGASRRYCRYRRLVEAHLREGWPVSRFAAALGVSPDRLHAARTEAARRSPQGILHDRLMLEAKRGLVYTTLPVSKIAFDLGFNDPAYFSRFFAARAGSSPAAFRRASRMEEA